MPWWENEAWLKAFPHDLDLLFEELAVGVLVDDGISEDFDFAGVVASADAESDATVGEDVGGGVVFGETDGVPHRVDVEAASESEVFGEMREVDEEHQQVGDALVSFALEVVLGAPDGVETEFIHRFCEGCRLVEHGCELLVGQPAFVGGCAGVSNVVHVDTASV